MNGSLLNYYFHCKRQCYLHAHKIKTEHTSDLVKLGKYYHQEFEDKDEDKKMINGVKIDKIEGEYLIEYKKSNSDIKAAEYQLLFYLWKLKQAGIIKRGKLKFKDNRADQAVVLTIEKEIKLKNVINKIEKLINTDIIPNVINKRKCRRCAYYEFCYS